MSTVWNARRCLGALRTAGFLLVAGAVSCSGGGGSPTAPGDGHGGRSLAIAFIPEQSPELNWIAAAQMVLRYYGIQIPDCRLQTYRVYMQSNGADFCCKNPSFCEPSAYDAVALKTVQLALAGEGLQSQYGVGVMLFDAVKAEIDAGRPVIAGDLNLVRKAVIFGYTGDGKFLVHDPHVGTISGVEGFPWNYSGAEPFRWHEKLFSLSR